MKIPCALSLCLLLAACMPGPSKPAAGARRPPEIASFAATLDELRGQAHIPGLSVAIVRDGKVILARAFGFADLEARRPATPETPYNIASVTKPISATVALKLVELGKLDLDRPMTTYRGYSEFCAGFREDGGIFARDLHCDTEPLTLRHMLSHTVNGKAGEAFRYNPPMYSWASRPMAEMTGEPFSALVERYVFVPAGMTRSARINRNLPLRADLAEALARPYHLDASGTLVRSEGPPPQGDGAAGGVISTVLDLAKFDLALDGGKLISPAAVRQMMTPMRNAAGAALPYGLGWFIQEYRGHKLVWHSGWWEKAYSALYLKVPDRHLTLILLANSEGVWWDNPLDKAEVEKSPFAAAFLERFVTE
ncbi:MAG: serine hydrolase domain-containing protein [Thermoanaerobaculia bacterium]